VYRARDKRLDRTVAIKILPAQVVLIGRHNSSLLLAGGSNTKGCSQGFKPHTTLLGLIEHRRTIGFFKWMYCRLNRLEGVASTG